jgi:hypothetical protein
MRRSQTAGADLLAAALLCGGTARSERNPSRLACIAERDSFADQHWPYFCLQWSRNNSVNPLQFDTGTLDARLG